MAGTKSITALRFKTKPSTPAAITSSIIDFSSWMLVFKELVSDAHPARIQSCPESTIGQSENGYVGFEGMQDQDVLSDQINVTL